MLTDPKKKVPSDLTYCNCQSPNPYTHTNNIEYCSKCGFRINKENKK